MSEQELNPTGEAEEQAATEQPTAEQPTAENAEESAASEQPVAEATGAEASAEESAAQEPVAESSGENSASNNADNNGSESGKEESKEKAQPLIARGAPSEYTPHVQRGRSRRIRQKVNIDEIDYRNIPLLAQFLDPYGRILSRRKTGVSAKIQRKAVREIKRARHLALLPYTSEQTRIVRVTKRS